MKFTIWGEVGAEGASGPVPLSGRLRLLLAGLLVGRNAEVSRNDLISIVWGEESEPANAEASLRQYVSRLRKALSNADHVADCLVTTPSGYRLDVDRSWVDADVLADAVAAGVQPQGFEGMISGDPYGAYCHELWCLAEVERQRDLAARAQMLQPASSSNLPTGTVTFLMTDMEDSSAQWDMSRVEMAEAVERHDDIIQSAIDRYHGYTFSTTGDGFAAAFERVSDGVDAAVEAQRALQAEHWPPPITVMVRMGLHTGEAQERGGDYFGPAVNRAARLMACGHGGQILASSITSALIDGYDLQLLGEHWLKDLRAPDRVSQVLADGMREDFDPIRSLDVIPNNLPAIHEALVGRDRDKDHVAEQLAEHPLVTVVGVGGIGKTRLALEVAAAKIDTFPDGVWWCELAPVSDTDAVMQAIGRVLGARQRPAASMAESIAEYCRHRRLLLVLDNCEHVLDATASLAELIAATGSTTAIVATSREALGCLNEQSYPLSSLTVDGDHPAAIELFLRRASELLPTREWTGAEVAGIERICRRLDGIPLAIELAASRIRSLSIPELEQRLDRAFQMLRGGRRRVERHRTMQAAIDWSYRTLDPAQALCFDRLAVFAGGWTLEAAEAIVTDGDRIQELQVLDILDDLIAKSLITADHSQPHQTRYRLLEPLRQFGEDQLATRGEADQTRDAHAAYYTTWAETWEDKSWNDELAWRIAIETELANLRTAVQWAIKNADADHALRLVNALSRAIAPFMFLEIGDWGAHASNLADANKHPLGPVVAGVSAPSYWWRGDVQTVTELVERAEAMPTYDPTASWPTTGRAMVEFFITGNHDAASRALNKIEARTKAEQLGLAWLRCGYFPEGSHADSDLEALHQIAAETGSTVATIQYNQAQTWVAMHRHDPVTAAKHTRRAIENARRIGARFSLHMSVSHLGLSAGATDGLTDDELELIVHSLNEQRDAGQETDQWLVLVTAAVVLWQHERQRLAAQIYQGLLASPWGRGHNVEQLMALLTGIDTYLPNTEPVRRLSDLVDQVLLEIPEILSTT